MSDEEIVCYFIILHENVQVKLNSTDVSPLLIAKTVELDKKNRFNRTN